MYRLHGNIQLSGSGALGDMLANHVKTNSKHEDLRVRTDTLGYAQRSYADTVSEIDAKEAAGVGRAAVKFALGEHRSGSVYIERLAEDPYGSEAKLTELSNVAKVTKEMPREYMNEAGNWVSEEFLKYLRPLVGGITEVGVLF